MVGFTFDGRPVDGIEGESLAAALTAAGIRGLRRTRTGAPGIQRLASPSGYGRRHS